MEILKFPDKRLLTPCKPVTSFGPELLIILDQMWDTMVTSRGIGLAANQVNLDMKMFVMRTQINQRLNIVNPKIIGHSVEISNHKEGCLSSPGDFLITNNRHKWITVRFFNETGAWEQKNLQGIDAVIFEHENDHILGKVFFQADTVPTKVRKRLEKRWGIR